MKYLLAIDQGTTSTRAVIFADNATTISSHQIELRQFFPDNGWVEHDAQEIWLATLTCCREAIAKANIYARDVAAIGISNQRETTVLWDKQSGQPIHHAIVWQDRRTSDFCETLRQQEGVVELISDKTGLVLDPYFCATKIHWLLDNVPGARERAEAGELLFGTIECFLLWKLTRGASHYTDATNASRTMLFNIVDNCWDDQLLALFDIPKALLPKVVDNVGHFGTTPESMFGDAIAICGMAGDQQAALIGQACFHPGMAKCTYGTGCFLVQNTGGRIIRSTHQLLSTVAYRINGKLTYAVEGSIFVAGAAVQWLRDGIGLVRSAKETEKMAASTDSTHGVYMVPAFTGLGAPYWNPEARGMILGLTRDTQTEHIVRAALESVCFRTKDLLLAIEKDGADTVAQLRVDGGMAANNWLLQFLADILGAQVDRPACIETSALGAAYLAGLGAGVYQSFDDITERWSLDARFSAVKPAEWQQSAYSGWLAAIRCVNNYA